MDTPKQKYLRAFAQRLLAFYSDTDLAGKADEKARYGIEVFIEAGIVSDLITKEELQPIIDRHHMDVFGRTIEQQRQHRGLEAAAEGDYSEFDRPAWERQGVTIGQ